MVLLRSGARNQPKKEAFGLRLHKSMRGVATAAACELRTVRIALLGLRGFTSMQHCRPKPWGFDVGVPGSVGLGRMLLLWCALVH